MRSTILTIALLALLFSPGPVVMLALETLAPRGSIYLKGSNIHHTESSVDLSGRNLILGAPGLDKAFIYEMNESMTYQLKSELPAPPLKSGENSALRFGEHVAISGNVAMVSGPRGLSLFEQNLSGEWLPATFEHPFRKGPTDSLATMDAIPSHALINHNKSARCAGNASGKTPSGEGERPFLIGNNWAIVEATSEAEPATNFNSGCGWWYLLTRLQFGRWRINYLGDTEFSKSSKHPLLQVGEYIVADSGGSDYPLFQVENETIRQVGTVSRPANLNPEAWRSSSESLIVIAFDGVYHVNLNDLPSNSPLEFRKYNINTSRAQRHQLEIFENQILSAYSHGRLALTDSKEFSQSHVGIISFPFPGHVHSSTRANFEVVPPDIPRQTDPVTNESIHLGHYSLGSWFSAKDGLLLSNGPKDTILITDLSAQPNSAPRFVDYPPSFTYNIAEGRFDFQLEVSDPEGEELSWFILKGNPGSGPQGFQLANAKANGVNTLALDTRIATNDLELAVVDPHGGEDRVTIPVTFVAASPPNIVNNGSRPQDLDEDQHPRLSQTFKLSARDPNSIAESDHTLNPESLSWTVGPYREGETSWTPVGEIGLTVSGSDVFIDYVPAPDWHGNDGFGITITDSTGLSDRMDLLFRVQAVNDPPRATGATELRGTPSVGQLLSAFGPLWTDLETPQSELELTYQWLVADDANGGNATAIPDATQSLVLIEDELEGKYVAVKISAEDVIDDLIAWDDGNQRNDPPLQTSVTSSFRPISANDATGPGSRFADLTPRPLEPVNLPKHLHSTRNSLHFFANDWISGFFQIEEPWRRFTSDQAPLDPVLFNNGRLGVGVEWRHSEELLLLGNEHRQQVFLFEELLKPTSTQARPLFPEYIEGEDNILYPDGRFFSVGKEQFSSAPFQIRDYQNETTNVIDTTRSPESDMGFWINTATDELYIFTESRRPLAFPYRTVDGEQTPTFSYATTMVEIFSFPDGNMLRTFDLLTRPEATRPLTGAGANTRIPLNLGWGTSPDHQTLLIGCQPANKVTPDEWARREATINLLLLDSQTGQLKRVIPTLVGRERFLYEWETGLPLSRPVSGIDCFIIAHSLPNTVLAALQFRSWETGDVMKSVLVEDGLFNHGAFYRPGSTVEWIYPSLNSPTLSVVNLDTGESLDRFSCFYSDLPSSPTESINDVQISENFKWITFREVTSRSIPATPHQAREGINVVVRHPLSPSPPEEPPNQKLAIYFEDFKGEADQWPLVEAARLPDHTIHLTNPSRNQIGAAWYREPIPVNGDFEATFEFRVNSPSITGAGADGLALVIHNDARGVNAIGGRGQALGVFPNPQEGVPLGIHPSLAIAFNTVNQDRASLIVTEAGSNSPRTLAIQSIGIGSNPAYLVSVRYHSLTSQLSVTLNGRTLMDRVSLPEQLTEWFGSETAHVGFTASTGDRWQRHSIESFSWVSPESNTTTSDSPIPHPADTNQDFRLTITEVTSYGSAWLQGEIWPMEPNPIPITYVTTAGTLWIQGEHYHQDTSLATAPQWWVTAPASQLRRASIHLEATQSMLKVQRTVERNLVTITLPPLRRPGAIAIEEQLPEGWVVDTISDGGYWNPSTQTVRWGPLFAESGSSLTYRVTVPTNTLISGTISGTASVNGIVTDTTGHRFVQPLDVPASLSIESEGGSLRIIIRGTPHAGYTLESSPSLAIPEWKKELQLQLPSSGQQAIPLSPTQHDLRFYQFKQ